MQHEVQTVIEAVQGNPIALFCVKVVLGGAVVAGFMLWFARQGDKHKESRRAPR